MQKSEKLISDFVIDIDSPKKYKNNDIKHSSLFQIFVEIAFGTLSRSDKKSHDIKSIQIEFDGAQCVHIIYVLILKLSLLFVEI